MGQLIIVDGINSKSRNHLANELAKIFDTTIYAGNISTPCFAYVDAMAPALDDDKNVVILYGWESRRTFAQAIPSLKHNIETDEVFFRMLDRIALSLSPIRIKCSLDGLGLELEYIKYQWYNTKSVLPSIYVDLNDYDLKSVVETIQTMSPIRNGPGIGCWGSNKFLLIGDRHGESLQPYNVKANLAFCSMSGVGCSEWLTKQLITANVPESELYWINAYDSSGTPTDDEFYLELLPTKTYALGSVAAEWCRKRGISFTQESHPQYWKRFYHHRPYPLIEHLQADLWHKQKMFSIMAL